MKFLSIKLSEWRSRVRKAANADNVIDLTVDILLLFLDVLATPILLPIRIAKHYLKKVVGRYMKKHTKATVNKIKAKGMQDG